MNRRLELPNLSTENSCLWLKLLPDPIAGMRAILLDKTSRSSLFSRFGGCPPCLIKEGLATNKISKVYGILNGTTNYILSEMENSNETFDKVLQKAQKLGYAETLIFGLRLIDPVFITVKCQQAAVRPESY